MLDQHLLKKEKFDLIAIKLLFHFSTGTTTTTTLFNL